MTYQELQDRLIYASHRKDLTTKVPQFIADAQTEISQRLTLTLAPFVNPDDTDEVLTSAPMLYFYAALAQLWESVMEFEAASYAWNRYDAELSNYYINAPGTAALVITPEEPSDGT